VLFCFGLQDTYCVRALVKSTVKQEKRDVDLDYSFRLNPSHIIVLNIGGAIINNLMAKGSLQPFRKKKILGQIRL